MPNLNLGENYVFTRVRWKDRMAICGALVLPDAKETLLGAIPVEAMDITVDTRLGKVAGAHSGQIVHRLY